MGQRHIVTMKKKCAFSWVILKVIFKVELQKHFHKKTAVLEKMCGLPEHIFKGTDVLTHIQKLQLSVPLA